MINLNIDYREIELIDHFKEYNIFTKKNLDIGDIEIFYNNVRLLVIERKTMKDLGASIRDGRYKEQKIRLKNIPTNNILYLIEGELENLKYGSISKDILMGAMTNIQFRDGIKVFRVKNIQETIFFIDKLINKLKKEDGRKYVSFLMEGGSGEVKENYIDSIQISKKANMNKEVFNSIVLSQIPGVSKNISKIIIKKFGSLKNLINEYEDKGSLLLKDIELEIKNGKKRKIGKVISNRIFDYLITNE